ncbi:hypothetical protein ACTDI4_01640 [Mesorhizobium sp. PUT5]|uniref:hypothetical protein n=1 Tax=Mesorhizobium sp. PUT5 TaxID=3454629 RepID=UPI003FA46D3E
MTEAPKSTKGNRQIVGLSLSPELARDLKVEAAERKMSLRKLFEEMWADYQERRNKARS